MITRGGLCLLMLAVSSAAAVAASSPPASAGTQTAPPWNPSYGYSYNWDYLSCPSGCGEWGLDVTLPLNTPIVAPEAGTIIGYQKSSDPCWNWAPGRLLLQLNRGGVIGFGHVSPVVSSGSVSVGQEIATIGPTQSCNGGNHVEFMYAPGGCSTSSCYNYSDFRCSPGCGSGTVYPLSDPLSPLSLLKSYMSGLSGSTITFSSTPPLNAVVGPNDSPGDNSPGMTATSTVQPTLQVGQSLTSATGAYSLDMQTDGNLVEYNSASKALWSSNTFGTGSANVATLQSDGNFVVYTSAGKPVWSSGTSGTGTGNTLVVQGDGNVVLYSSSGKALWDTGTSGTDTYRPEATGGGSGNPVTFSIDPSSSSVCNVSSGVVTFIGSGTCTIDANQAGSSQVKQSFIVGPENQTITSTSTPPTSTTVGGVAYTPTATSASGLPVTFTLDGTSSGCTLSSGEVNFTAVGTCVIDAKQAGTAHTLTSGTSSMTEGQEITVGQQLTSANGDYKLDMQGDGNLVEYNSASKALWSSNTSGTGSANFATLQSDGNFVVYTSTGNAVWNSGTSGTGSGNTLVIQGDGNIVLYPPSGPALWDTSTDGYGAYNSAPSVQQSLSVGKGTPTTPAISNLPTKGNFGGSFAANVSTNGDGNTSVTSNSTSICTVSGFLVSYVGVGACSLTAHVATGTNYTSADGVVQTFTVSRASQSALTITTLSGHVGTALTLSTSGGSGAGALTYVVANGTSRGCRVVGSSMSATTAGTCIVTATKAADTTYLAISSRATTISLAAKALSANPATITVTFANKSNALSRAAKKSLATLAKKLASGASVTFTGYARGNARLAQSRVRNAARYLSSKVSIHATLKKVTSLTVNKVTVTTTKR